MTVPNDCYSFLIEDIYGDGMNSGYGVGSYRIFGNGVQISGVQGGTFGSSETKSFSVANPLSNDEFSTSSVSIYPNPTKGIVTISTESSVDIVITDLTGKVVFAKNKVSNNESINLTGLQSGVYLAKLNQDGVVETKKIILN